MGFALRKETEPFLKLVERRELVLLATVSVQERKLAEVIPFDSSTSFDDAQDGSLGTGTWTWEHDSLNRITQTVDSDSRIVQYKYDALGRRTSLTYPDSMQVSYTWTDDNLLYQIQEGGTTRVTYTYDDAHRTTQRRYSNGVKATYNYNDANELTSLTNTKSLTTLSSYSYTYDDLGNRTQQIDNLGTHTFQYDAISQLTQALYATGTQQDYVYDGVHNRETFTQSGSATTYSTNNMNQITQSVLGANTTTYSWDTNGNLSEKLTATATTTFAHNILNQLTEWTSTGKTAVTFEYDPLGRRISKTVGATIYQYTWDGAQLIEVRNSAGTVQRKFVYGAGIDEPVYIKRNSARYFYTQDGLGSVSELTNSSGSKIEYYTYDVYGKPTLYNSAGTQITRSRYSNPYYFTGREYDFETSLYNYRARYYDPVLGRFIETDPLGYLDSLNLYSYVGNNPVNWIDPFGWAKETNGSWSFYKWLYTGDGKASDEVYNAALDAAADTLSTYFISVGGSITTGHLTQSVSIDLMNLDVSYNVSLSATTIYGASLDLYSGQPGGVYDVSVGGLPGPAEHAGISASFDTSGNYTGTSLHLGGGLGLPVDASWDFINGLSDNNN